MFYAKELIRCGETCRRCLVFQVTKGKIWYCLHRFLSMGCHRRTREPNWYQCKNIFRWHYITYECFGCHHRNLFHTIQKPLQRKTMLHWIVTIIISYWLTMVQLASMVEKFYYENDSKDSYWSRQMLIHVSSSVYFLVWCLTDFYLASWTLEYSCCMCCCWRRSQYDSYGSGTCDRQSASASCCLWWKWSSRRPDFIYTSIC